MWINKIGLEIEGGWNKPKWRDAVIIGDDSLPASPPKHWATGKSCQHYGEIVSSPMKLADALKWTVDHYPDGGSDRCSIHVHISTKTVMAYAELATLPFYNKFLNDMGAWGLKNQAKMTSFDKEMFFERLAGKNKYCKNAFRPARQMFRVVKHPPTDDAARRSILNYCWALHGTMEVRVLPLFTNPDLAVSAIGAIHDCVEEFLAPGNWGEVKSRKGRLLFRDMEAIQEASVEIS